MSDSAINKYSITIQYKTVEGYEERIYASSEAEARAIALKFFYKKHKERCIDPQILDCLIMPEKE